MRKVMWFRAEELRLADNEPLCAAAEEADCLLCVFVLEPKFFAEGKPAEGPHEIQHMLECLSELGEGLRKRGSDLFILEGPATEAIPELVARFEIDEVVAQATVNPFGRERDADVKKSLAVPLTLTEGQTLLPPGSVCTQAGGPYAVYTPFARSARDVYSPTEPRPAPKRLPAPPEGVDGFGRVRELPTLSELGIEENPDVVKGGERAAKKRLDTFLEKHASRYHEDRDRLDLPGTSRLSQDLKFGTLSVRTAYFEASKRISNGKAKDRMQLELLWREFAHHTLYHRPRLLSEPYREDFEGFPWQENDAAFEAWCEGRTGYPVVDAAARQLLREGFVHNRARMIAASFLAKHLLLPWWLGEAHYMRFLTDGDPAQNNMGWQWSAGCGCDAQPYFRVFNPMTQGEKFDPEGEYVRRYVPELAKLPTKHIHAPWKAPEGVRKDAGVKLGDSYPEPIVDHREARERFLAIAKDHLKKGG